jgi:hypothetical protein
VRFFLRLCDDHWGEHVALWPDNSVEFELMAVDLTDDEVQAARRTLVDWVQARPADFTADLSARTMPFALWDTRLLSPESIRHDDRPGQPAERFWWAGNQHEVSWYLHAFGSRWLPGRLLADAPAAVTDALFEASRHWPVRLDFNKALWEAAPAALARDRTTAVNPAAFDAAALVLTASWQQYVYPGVPGHEPDPDQAEIGARQVGRAMDVIRALAPDAGSYVNETDYFEPGWQRSFWGDNYPRLLQVKQKYDPANLFRVHHGVGSDRPAL